MTKSKAIMLTSILDAINLVPGLLAIVKVWLPTTITPVLDPCKATVVVPPITMAELDASSGIVVPDSTMAEPGINV